MVPVYVKGGMWTNVEDEILKAAIAKYGLNQWSRVSSLLTRKNAKQCKLRWQEWLDPRIKKSDWSPEEDRKLLNLAKLRPNQWSSISLLLNRTTNQCIERYQELLTDFTGIGGADENAKDGASSLLLTGNAESTGARNSAGSSLGGLNLNPESKPARADLDEMDEDEKEMISEARARLTNTQGKKAKRKARERILEESRRVAELLRRRELKQVGIKATLKNKKKFKDQMDYNADIAFERRPEEGKFDTTNELKANLKEKYLFDKTTQVKGTFNQEVLVQKRKEKRRREQNRKLAEKSHDIASDLQHVEEGADDDDKNFAEEFSKRKRMRLAFTDEEPREDIENAIDKTVKEIVKINTEKSILFAGRRNFDKELDNEPEVLEDKKLLKIEEKTEKKRKKEERRKIIELLSSLPEAEDDFELDIDGILNPEAEAKENIDDIEPSRSGLKAKLPKVIVDKTEQRRLEKIHVKELKKQLSFYETPQAMKRGLPIPSFLTKNSNPKDEIEAEMEKLIRFKTNNDESLSDTRDMERSLAIWSLVEGQVEEETTKLIKTGKYDHLLNSEAGSITDKNLLLQMIKRYTEKSNEIEEGLLTFYSKKKAETGIDSIMKDILQIKNETQEVEDELWAYTQFQDMESESIKVRKERTQKELDTINQLIDQKRRELFSR